MKALHWCCIGAPSQIYQIYPKHILQPQQFFLLSVAAINKIFINKYFYNPIRKYLMKTNLVIEVVMRLATSKYPTLRKDDLQICSDFSCCITIQVTPKTCMAQIRAASNWSFRVFIEMPSSNLGLHLWTQIPIWFLILYVFLLGHFIFYSSSQFFELLFIVILNGMRLIKCIFPFISEKLDSSHFEDWRRKHKCLKVHIFFNCFNTMTFHQYRNMDTNVPKQDRTTVLVYIPS